MIKTKFIQTISVIDPDTLQKIEVCLYKLETGGIVGVDASFIETEEDVYSPFDKGVKLDIEE